jgi:hypothetical protein
MKASLERETGIDHPAKEMVVGSQEDREGRVEWCRGRRRGNTCKARRRELSAEKEDRDGIDARTTSFSKSNSPIPAFAKYALFPSSALISTFAASFQMRLALPAWSTVMVQFGVRRDVWETAASRICEQ